ncbi:MAG: AAA family ATPase, partial [Planctomycetales bacterium]|nr:AAA family ATPase [Planctomycetales bacterium]
MRIQQLLLAAFGPFTDQQLSFEKPGLHVVYGPNEAGKTSALRAIQAALFGIPVRTNDNFLHANNKLRVGAVVQNEDGGQLHFLRRKGNKNTLLNPELDVETAHPDAALQPFLTGVDAESFAQIHGIDHQRLRQGGEQLQQLQGLVGESLFAAGMGGVSLAKVLSSLADEADGLFSSKRTCRIRAAKSKHADALKARQMAEVPSSKWQKLQDELAEVRQERESILQRYTAAQRERNRLLRIQSALQPLAKRARLIAELTELGDVAILPDEYSSAQRSHIHGRIVELTEQEKQLAHKLDGPNGLRQQLQQLDLPQELLARREPIHQLRQQLGAYLKARQDLDGPLRLEQQTIASQIHVLLEDMGDDSSGDSHVLTVAKRWLIGSAERRSIQALAREEKTVRTAPRATQQKQDELQNQLQHQQAALDSMSEVADTHRLSELIEQAQLAGDVDSVMDELKSTCDDTQQQIDARFASLGLWNGALADVTKLALPLHETIERFQQQWDQQASRSEQLQLALADCQQEISEVTATVDALQQAGRVPSEDDLQAARNIRNQTWVAIRQAWLDGQLDLDSLTDAIANYSGAQGYSVQSAEQASEFFEDTVADADDLADRLRREADRVAQVGERLARIKQLHEKQALLTQEQINAKTEQTELQQQWLELWQPLGITAPLPPQEMLRWMDRVFKLQELLAEQNVLQKRLTFKQQQREQLVS